jgi:hypothetical protein
MDEFELVAEELRDLGNGVSVSVVIQPAGPRECMPGSVSLSSRRYVGR